VCQHIAPLTIDSRLGCLLTGLLVLTLNICLWAYFARKTEGLCRDFMASMLKKIHYSVCQKNETCIILNISGYHVLNFIAVDLQLYKIFKIMRVLFLAHSAELEVVVIIMLSTTL